MNDPHRANRYRLDFMTNPAYEWLKGEIGQVQAKEMKALLAAGRGEAEHQFNHQAGVVDGIERVQVLKQRLEEEARGAHRQADE